MQILIGAIGKLGRGPEHDLCARYGKRLDAMARQIGFGPVESFEIAESRAAKVVARKSEEAARLLERAGGAEYLIALDEGGKRLDSLAFAAMLGERRDEGARSLAFLIGGPDGHGPDVLVRADTTLSLGSMTLPYALARIVLIEQIYRAATILTGHPYHRR